MEANVFYNHPFELFSISKNKMERNVPLATDGHPLLFYF